MHATADRLEFAPPATPGLLRALLLAVLAHGLLALALTFSVQWKRDAQILSAEAELWSAIPEEAAPALQEPEPEPPAPPVQNQPPPPMPAAEPPAPTPPQVDIALQQEKLRIKKQQAQEEARQEQLRQDQQKKKLEKLRVDKEKRDQAQLEKLKQDKQKQDKLKQELAQKAQQTVQDKKKAALEAQQLEAQRVKNLQRMAGMAGATGAANATGTALKSSGPSASYAGRIRARIKPNIVFTEEVQGNPTAEVEVRLAPDGTVVGRKVVKSSGLKAWDDAVVKAIDKTEVLPRDVDGSMPSSLLLVFRPKD